MLWKAIEGEADKYLDSRKPTTILAPAPDAAVLLPAHLDALCQTAPLAVPSPDVSYFIHGPQRDSAEVQVCWRADLGDEWTKWAEIVRLLPPTSLECMTVPLTTVRKWLVNEPDPASADAAAQMIDEGVETHLPENDSIGGRMVLIWRGQESEPADDPRDLKPGDTIVIPTQQYGWEAFGHIPDAPTAADTKSATIEQRPAFLERRDAVDCAEYAMASGKRRVVVRIHSVFTPPALLLNHALAPEGTLSRDEIRDELHPLFETIVRNVLQRRPSLDEESKRRLATAVEQVRRGAFDPHIYPKSQHGRAGLVIIFRKLLPNPSDLPQISSSEEENGEPLPDAVVPVRLEDHTRHVVDRLIACLDIEKESLGVDKATFVRAAELHDIGKADIRFQALLLGATPQEAMERPTLLAKSGNSILTRQEAADARQRSKLPDRFRHEMLSVGIIKNALVVLDPSADHDLLVHLIAAHHGYARPLAPVVIDEKEDTETNAAFAERLELKRTLNHGDIDGNRRLRWVPAHHFDSGIAERFWMLIRRAEIGWWGLAYRESILRIADQQASEAEQNQKEPK
ncbi:MAG TPA: HD domain-containing protein [Tepidisphaeraceae bacterium]